MNKEVTDLSPAALDAWLRDHLRRRMVVLVLALPTGGAAYESPVMQLDELPSALMEALAAYG